MLNDPTMAQPPVISPPVLKLATPDPDQIYSTAGPAMSSATFGDKGVLELVEACRDLPLVVRGENRWFPGFFSLSTRS